MELKLLFLAFIILINFTKYLVDCQTDIHHEMFLSPWLQPNFFCFWCKGVAPALFQGCLSGLEAKSLQGCQEEEEVWDMEVNKEVINKVNKEGVMEGLE